MRGLGILIRERQLCYDGGVLPYNEYDLFFSLTGSKVFG